MEELPQYEHLFQPRRGGFAPQAKSNILKKPPSRDSQEENKQRGKSMQLVVNPSKMPFIKNKVLSPTAAANDGNIPAKP